MNNIGGFGFKVALTASVTFPMGITISQFSDDADPYDSPAIKIRDTAMGVNGDLVVWGKAAPVPITLNVIPGSDDDRNLAVLSRVNKVGAGKVAVTDVINMNIIYPDGSKAILLNGVITDAPPSKSVGSAGRLKTNSYSFAFENIV